MGPRRPPDTATGHYVFHDFRSIDWDRWRAATVTERMDVIAEAETFLTDAADDAGDLASFSVIGHKADLLVLVIRPDLASIDTYQRQFERLAFASYTSRRTSAIGVTEASGYTDAAAAYFDEDATADPGIERYMETRLYPEIPDAGVISYYPMNKRRDPEYNWYDLPYEERAAHVSEHGTIGKRHAGSVVQMITGTIGFEEWEWGITLFAEELPAIKDLLTEMRYDPSTSKYAEFGPFYVGRRFPIADLEAFMAGEPIPTDGPDETGVSLVADLTAIPDTPNFSADAWAVLARSDAEHEAVSDAVADLAGNFDHYDSHEGTTVTEADGETVVISGWESERAAETAAGFLTEIPGVVDATVGRASGNSPEPTAASTETQTATSVRETLTDRDVYAGKPHGEDVHALVLYSRADRDTLVTALEELRERFEGDGDHRSTRVYRTRAGERAAVVSLWTTPEGAEHAATDLESLPGIESDADEDAGFGTMGMFYTVKPSYREAFVSTFDDVADVVGDMEGHRATDLLVNVENDRDMFIASRWAAKEDAMAFFRSDAFRETVDWGRDVLEDRPRHVFLA